MTKQTFDRRRFMQLAATGVVGAAAASARGNPEKAEPAVARYVRLGRTDLRIADISFGASRLRHGEEQLVHHALARGINYFDSADSYTGGASETVIGNALASAKTKREDVVLVSKAITDPNDSVEDLMRTLEHSLKRLRTDYVDVYFSHAVNDVERLKADSWHTFVDRARQQGKIRFTGLSGHAGRLTECVDYAIDNDLVDVLLLAFNFGQDPAFYERITRRFDFVATQPGLPRVLAKARKNDIGIVAMKTLMGARLNDLRPFEYGDATFAQAALRWTLANEHLDAAIISMTSTAVIDEYLGASGSGEPSTADIALLTQYLRRNGKTYCKHACNDCEGACPYGVPIADVLRTRMYATDYQDEAFARSEYGMLDVNAAACVGCSGAPCASACTHGLPIAELCAPTHGLLS